MHEYHTFGRGLTLRTGQQGNMTLMHAWSPELQKSKLDNSGAGLCTITRRPILSDMQAWYTSYLPWPRACSHTARPNTCSPELTHTYLAGV